MLGGDVPQFPEPYRDDAGEDERPTDELDPPRCLAEQEPGDEQREEHLGQSDEG